MSKAEKILKEDVIDTGVIEAVATPVEEVKEDNVLFEVKAQENRSYKFSIPSSAPLFECFDATVVFLSNLIETTKKNLANAQDEAKLKEESNTLDD